MKISSACKSSILLFVLTLAMNTLLFGQQKSLTEKEAKDWVKSKQWADGLPINVYSDVNSVEFAKQYNNNKEEWDKAFAFIKEKNLKELPVNKYPIDGNNVYATITEGPDKEYDKTTWESHRKYIDLQYIITGEEKMEVAPLANATVTKPYDETKDGANYIAKGKLYTATPKEFYLFFPDDAHRPSIKVDGYDNVKKLVIKIRYVN
jgi:YhcH/YjgK/YiaL family protein